MQLKKYDESEGAAASYFVVIQVDNKQQPLDKIQALDKKLNLINQKVKIIDGRIKKSASLK